MPFNPAQNPLLNDFQGGQMTDLPAYPGGVDPTALLEIVSPGTAAAGVNYAISLAQLIAIIGSSVDIYPAPTIITAGAVYNSVGSDTRILVNKTIGSATSIVLASGLTYVRPVLVKDLKGDADVNPITVTFTGVQKMDTLTSVVISNPFAWFWFNPLANGNFYEAA